MVGGQLQGTLCRDFGGVAMTDATHRRHIVGHAERRRAGEDPSRAFMAVSLYVPVYDCDVSSQHIQPYSRPALSRRPCRVAVWHTPAEQPL